MMKPSRIYLKIFLSFLLILMVTEILIFVLFGIIVGSHLRSETYRYASTQVMMVKEIIESKMRTAPGEQPRWNESLDAFIEELGGRLGAQVWLQKEDGKVVAKSFQGDMPEDQVELKRGRSKNFGSFMLYHGRRSGAGAYAVVPIALDADKGSELHVLFARSGSSHPEGGFALGLGIIGVVIALLVIPVSRFISKPINELRESARRIGEGELSHRAAVKGKDEIAKLCSVFNHMADRLEKTIRGGRELTAHISHELRTPLTRIRLAEEMLREKMEKQNCAGLDRYLNDIREDIEELDVLIGRILTLSKLDLKEKPLSFEQLSPADLMNGLLSRLKPAMDKKNLDLSTDVSFEPLLRGDHDALQTAFSNILENAVKYSPPGGRVRVDMKAAEGVMEVVVTNTADPFPEEELDRIFEPFHRFGTSKEGGFGLGLAIARKIIELHGGAIWAQNVAEGFRINARFPRNPME
jgi:signal transduction histidine kinase